MSSLNNRISIYTDGGSRGNPGPAAAAYWIGDLDTGEVLYHGSQFLGVATNNQAEYQALINALEWLLGSDLAVKASELKLYSDSLLMVNQINRLYRVKDLKIVSLFSKVNQLISELKVISKSISINTQHIPRSLNSYADSLVNMALDSNLITG